jgi:hypothetical protein
MPLPKWLKPLASLWSKAEQALGISSKVAVAVSAVSMSAAVAPRIEAQTRAPAGSVPRPPYSTARDTVRRYGEKFILTPSDSVVVRVDTTWYPRTGGGAVASDSTGSTVRSPAPGATTRTPTARPRSTPSTGGSGGHRSHYSHRSHSSHRSHRSGGWV